MPKKSKTTSRKAQPKRKVAKRRGGGTARSGMSGAPVAVSDFLQQSTRFSSTNGGRSLVMHVQAPLALIGRDASTSLAALFVRNSATSLTSTNYFQLTFNPIAGVGYQVTGASEEYGYWINPIWSLIAACFVRYKVLKFKFIYQPQSAATTDDQLVFAFAADPYHPVIGPSAGTVGNSNLLSVADSMPFMPWREWELDVTEAFQGDQPFYCRPPSGASVSSATRLSSAGVFACTGTGSKSAITYGVLYGCISLEFQEFCPQVTGEDIPMLSLLTPKMPTPSERLIDEVTAEVRRRMCGDRSLTVDVNKSRVKEEVFPQFETPGSMASEPLSPRYSGEVVPGPLTHDDEKRIAHAAGSPPALIKLGLPDGEITILLKDLDGEKQIYVLDRSDCIQGIRLVEVLKQISRRYDLPLKSIHLGDYKCPSEGENKPSLPLS